MRKIPELLAPAGNYEKLATVIHYGADAVYLGSSRFSLRHKADNFEAHELSRAVEYCHSRGKRVYVTVNIFPHNVDLPLIEGYIDILRSAPPDAVIVSDLGVFSIFNKTYPEMPIHISTQANVTNRETALFWQSLGAKRLILSRELSIGEIREIKESVSIEIEVFVHGSICLSYSGRCYISSFLASRGANRGLCTNSCRWNYSLVEEKRPGEFMPVMEDSRGTYLLSSKDLCMIEHLDKLVDAGLDSLKIEGRIKGINYAAGVVKVYREALDSLRSGETYKCNTSWLKELQMFSSRGYTTGMFFGSQPDNDYNFDGESYRMTRELVAIVKEIRQNKAVIALRNRLDIGNSLEFLTPGLGDREFILSALWDAEGSPITTARNEDIVIIKIPEGVRVGDIIRRKSSKD